MYLINLLGKLVLGLWLDSELHYFSIFTENKNKYARYRRQSALQKYNSDKRASIIALSYGVDVDK